MYLPDQTENSYITPSFSDTNKTSKAKNLKCTKTEAIKARINMNKEKSTCLRAVTASPPEDASDEEGYQFPPQDKARVT